MSAMGPEKTGAADRGLGGHVTPTPTSLQPPAQIGVFSSHWCNRLSDMVTYKQDHLSEFIPIHVECCTQICLLLLLPNLPSHITVRFILPHIQITFKGGTFFPWRNHPHNQYWTFTKVSLDSDEIFQNLLRFFSPNLPAMKVKYFCPNESALKETPTIDRKYIVYWGLTI